MRILVALTPFIAFAVIHRTSGMTMGLIVGAASSAMFMARDWFVPDRGPKILEIGMTVLFGALLAFALIANPAWSIHGGRLFVTSGLLAIVLVPIAIGRPFALRYARGFDDWYFWRQPGAVLANHVVTAVWALNFALMVLADIALLNMPRAPLGIDVAVEILAGLGALWFTSWYPGRVCIDPR
jgi:hypothetical protein